jgi:hypothetical protein
MTACFLRRFCQDAANPPLKTKGGAPVKPRIDQPDFFDMRGVLVPGEGGAPPHSQEWLCHAQTESLTQATGPFAQAGKWCSILGELSRRGQVDSS